MWAALQASSLQAPWRFTDTLSASRPDPRNYSTHIPQLTHSVPCLSPAHSHTTGPLPFHRDAQFQERNDC